MSKAPLPGRCKTRLAPRLGQHGAARLQRQLLKQRGSWAKSLPCPVEIHASPDLRHPSFLRLRRHGLALRKQYSGNLGQRMRKAQGQRPVVIIGTDCPSLLPGHVLWALDELCHGRAACIPANDGGYVLLALPRSTPVMFHGVSWGSNRVMQQSKRLQQRSQLSWKNAEPLPDLDTPQDYARQRRARLFPGF